MKKSDIIRIFIWACGFIWVVLFVATAILTKE